MTDDARIEALLFYRSEPVSIDDLGTALGLAPAAVREALDILRARLSGTGLSLVEAGGSTELRTTPEAAGLIEGVRKAELDRDLGNAGAETLSIILYRGPLSRSDIEYVRGVNSTFILRNLLMRGLVERKPSPKDQRSFLYEATPDLLALLGVSRAEELPEYASVRAEMESLKRTEPETEEKTHEHAA